MTPEELFAIWAPADSIWSQWVIPVPFAQIMCLDAEPEKSSGIPPEPNGLRFDPALAIVVDLPGGDAVRYGVTLARVGFRPVAVFDGSPGPFTFAGPVQQKGGVAVKETAIVDMRDLLFALCTGASVLQTVSLAANAPPVFLVDSQRMKSSHTPEELFDNRWKVFPQGFPSAKFLRAQGIRRVLLLQEKAGQPQEDLAHVLVRWQEAGLEIVASGSAEASETAMRVARPSRFRASWYRGLEILGLRRSSVGGFGGYPYEGLSG
jgi:hypothetical protein